VQVVTHSGICVSNFLREVPSWALMVAIAIWSLRDTGMWRVCGRGM
jgi:hypothetical protein